MIQDAPSTGHKIAVIIKLANATTLDQSAVHTVTNETAPMNKNALPAAAALAPAGQRKTHSHSLARRSPDMIRFAAAVRWYQQILLFSFPPPSPNEAG